MNCKHKEVNKIRNCRDDASFEYYVHCDICKKWIAVYDFNGEYRKK